MKRRIVFLGGGYATLSAACFRRVRDRFSASRDSGVFREDAVVASRACPADAWRGTVADSWEIAAPLSGLHLSKIQGTHGAAAFESNGVGLAVSGRRGAEPRYTLSMAQRDLELVEQACGVRACVPSFASGAAR